MRSGLFVLLLILVIASGVTVVAQDKKYGGVDNCKMCHPDPYADWSKTAHAKSFDLLVNVGQEKNAECLPCHSTGYGKGGFVDDAATPGLKGTTCEACHGPGADHMGDKTKIQRVPPATTCSACHQKNNIHSIAAK
ncbi:MAG: cytochrome c family protein [Armatimonadetes bacterium]|nr:cytochrome c family protein [Armatimonadota bacterium]